MRHIHFFINKLIVAAALAFSSAAAMAGPTYSVTLDTASLAGTVANLDLSFGSFGDATPTTAVLTNFSGNYGIEVDRLGNVTGDAGSVVSFINVPGVSYLTYLVTLGGVYQFNVTFGDDLTSPETAIFALTLFDEAFNAIGGAPAVQFTLQGALNGEPVQPLIDVSAGLSQVAEVPEPSQLLLMLSALAMLGMMLRRRSSK